MFGIGKTKEQKKIGENIIRVENEQVLHIKTELTLYLIGEKSFVPFFSSSVLTPLLLALPSLVKLKLIIS